MWRERVDGNELPPKIRAGVNSVGIYVVLQETQRLICGLVYRLRLVWQTTHYAAQEECDVERRLLEDPSLPLCRGSCAILERAAAGAVRYAAACPCLLSGPAVLDYQHQH